MFCTTFYLRSHIWINLTYKMITSKRYYIGKYTFLNVKPNQRLEFNNKELYYNHMIFLSKLYYWNCAVKLTLYAIKIQCRFKLVINVQFLFGGVFDWVVGKNYYMLMTRNNMLLFMNSINICHFLFVFIYNCYDVTTRSTPCRIDRVDNLVLRPLRL